MPICRVCLGVTPDGAEYHPPCLRRLFTTATLPSLDVDLGTLSDMAQRMAGRMSISGMQQKVLVSLTADRTTIEFRPAGGRYILKPPINTFPEIPANEHLTMQMARLVGIPIPNCGLIHLRDGNLAYIVERFDRTGDGQKLHQEDFSQLAELPPADKYDQSAELCVRLLRKYASEPPVSVLALYRLLLFAWCVGNCDLHLKNLSMLTGTDGASRLSPAYDLVNTKLVIRDDRFALTVLGKTSNLRRADWLRFGEYCQLPPRAVDQVVRDQVRAVEQMATHVHRSFLSPEMKRRYEEIMRQNVAVLAG